MRTLWLTALLLGGCTDGWWVQTETGETGDTPPVDDGCDGALSAPSVGQVSFSQFVLDGVGLTVGFNNSLTHKDKPVACVGEQEVQFLAFLNDEPFAWFYFEPQTTGDFNVGGTGVVTVIDVIGSNSPTLFANSDFTAGSWTVYETGGTQIGQVINAVGINNEHSLAFAMSYEFQP